MRLHHFRSCAAEFVKWSRSVHHSLSWGPVYRRAAHIWIAPASIIDVVNSLITGPAMSGRHATPAVRVGRRCWSMKPVGFSCSALNLQTSLVFLINSLCLKRHLTLPFVHLNLLTSSVRVKSHVFGDSGANIVNSTSDPTTHLHHVTLRARDRKQAATKFRSHELQSVKQCFPCDYYPALLHFLFISPPDTCYFPSFLHFRIS